SEKGALAPYVYDDVPKAFRHALVHLISEPVGRAAHYWRQEVERESKQWFGWAGNERFATFVMTAEVDALLEFIEIVIESSTAKAYLGGSRGGYERSRERVMPDVETRVNHLCERHRFGYRFDDGDARRIGSPALDTGITGPALVATQRPGWEQVDKN